MFVYVIVNSETLKVYIGKTVRSNLQKYLREKLWCAQKGRWNGRSRLFVSMQKHSSTVWSIHPLLQGQTEEELNTHEKLLIKALKAQHPDIGYNLCDGGQGNSAKRGPCPQAVREKISRANTGKKRSAEYIKQMSARVTAWYASRERTKPTCHPERPHASHGLCDRCYNKSSFRSRATCHPKRPQVAKGLCKHCYKRVYRRRRKKMGVMVS